MVAMAASIRPIVSTIRMGQAVHIEPKLANIGGGVMRTETTRGHTPMLTPNNFMPVEHDWVPPQPAPSTKAERIATNICRGIGDLAIDILSFVAAVGYVALIIGGVFWIVSHF